MSAKLQKLKGLSTASTVPFLVENRINRQLLLNALRDSGYDRIEALADLLDNSIDAQASRVLIDVFSFNGKPVILLADNGVGMSQEQVLNALSVGSTRTDRVKDSRGKYGMGLTSASASLGDGLTVISKQADKYSAYGYVAEEITDVSWPIKDQLTTFNQDLFDHYLPGVNNGTLVIIKEVTRFHSTEINAYREEIYQKIGITFRKFMPKVSFGLVERSSYYCTKANLLKATGIVSIEPIDPLLLAHGSQVLLDKVKEVSLGGVKLSLKLKAVLLPEEDPQVNGCKVNIQNQGFYILRNQRQIDGGSTFGKVLHKHNMYNRFRAEISFDTLADNAFGVNYQKRGYTPVAALIKTIEEEFSEVIKQVKHYSQLQSIKKRSEFLELDNKISKLAAPLLDDLLEKTPDGVPKPKVESQEAPPKEPKEPKDKTDKIEKAYKKLGMNAPKFEYVSDDPEGSLYSYLVLDGSFTIRINVNHALYQAVHSDNLDGSELFRLMLLCTSIAEASTLKLNNSDEVRDLFEEVRESTSSGLVTITNLYLN